MTRLRLKKKSKCNHCSNLEPTKLCNRWRRIRSATVKIQKNTKNRLKLTAFLFVSLLYGEARHRVDGKCTAHHLTLLKWKYSGKKIKLQMWPSEEEWGINNMQKGTFGEKKKRYSLSSSLGQEELSSSWSNQSTPSHHYCT